MNFRNRQNVFKTANTVYVKSADMFCRSVLLPWGIEALKAFIKEINYRDLFTVFHRHVSLRFMNIPFTKPQVCTEVSCV